MAISPKKKVAGGGDRGQNIQVFVRCRPLNNAEKDARSFSVVDCPNSREVTVKVKSLSNHQTKTFQFDKVFGVQSKQIEVYRAVVEPLILQVTFYFRFRFLAFNFGSKLGSRIKEGP